MFVVSLKGRAAVAVLIMASFGLSTSASAVNNINIITGGVNDGEVSGDGTVNAGDGGAVDFSIGPIAIETFVGDVSLASTIDIIITDAINKLNGGISFTSGGSLFIRSGMVATSGTQTYAGAVILDGQPTGVSVPTNLTGSTVTFDNTLDGVTFQSDLLNPATDLPSQDLTITGNSVFNGAVGGNTALKSLSVSGTSNINGGSVTTTGAQTYSDAVALGANTSLTNGAGAANIVSFGSDVDGAFDLSVANDVVFNGNVGSNASLATVTVNGNNVVFNGAAGVFKGSLSSASAVVNETGTTQFNGGTLNTGTVQTTGNAVFNAAASAGGIIVDGSSTINGNLTTTGAQTYTGAVTLGANTILTNGAGGVNKVTFDSAVAGGLFDLTVSNAATFNGNVDVNQLNLLGQSDFDSSIVTTTQAQDYTNSVFIGGGNAVFNGPTVTFSNLLSGSGGVVVNPTAGAATFKDDVSLFDLTVNGNTVFDSTPAFLDLTVNTTAQQTYNGDVTFTGPAGKNVSLQASANDITFGGVIKAVNGPDLTLDGNNVFFGGDVGAAAATDRLGSLTVTAGSDTFVNAGGNFFTSGDIRLEGDAVLGVNTYLKATNTNSEVLIRKVDGTVMGAQDLFVVAGKDITALGAIGSVTKLKDLDFNTGAGGKILLANSASVFTWGDQTYQDSVLLNHQAGLGGDVTTMMAKNITFANTVDAQNSLDTNEVLDITLKPLGVVMFNGVVGGVVPLKKIVVDGGAAVVNANITVSDSLVANNGLNLANATTVTGNVVVKGKFMIGNSPGQATIDADLLLDPTTIWDLEIGGLLAGAEFDFLNVTGTATIDGVLDVRLIDPLGGGAIFAPVLGDSFDILTAELINGGFDNILFGLAPLGLNAGLAWDANVITDAFGTTDVFRLSVVSSVPLPSAVWFFSSGLIGLIGLSRRRSQKSGV